eukprot:jgi/Orpsp1_1/1190035/evm.model.d7180000076251.1
MGKLYLKYNDSKFIELFNDRDYSQNNLQFSVKKYKYFIKNNNEKNKFENEISKLKKLEHKNVVRVFNFYLERGNILFKTEHCQTNLKDFLHINKDKIDFTLK